MSNNDVFAAGRITNAGLDIITADIKAGKYPPETALDLGLLVEEVRLHRQQFFVGSAVNPPMFPEGYPKTETVIVGGAGPSESVDKP